LAHTYSELGDCGPNLIWVVTLADYGEVLERGGGDGGGIGTVDRGLSGS
jgi:hypothetical protein